MSRPNVVAVGSLVLLCGLSCGLSACGAPPGGASRRGGAATPGSAVGFSRPPTVEGSRRACLAPPYAPASDVSELADGTTVTPVGEREWVFVLAGDHEATQEQTTQEQLNQEQAHALLTRVREADPALRALSYGLYCAPRLCFRFEGALCETNVEQVVAQFRRAVAGAGAQPGTRLELSVALAGSVGPRCDEGDPNCLPIPYETGVSYDPSRARHAGPLATHSAGACRHDGECQVMGCGNHCTSWEYGGAHEAGTCEGYAFDAPVFCGCVQGQCAWFDQ